jgi:hypothetical protein
MKRLVLITLGVLSAAVAMTVPVAGTRKTFVPDWTFKGSALTGWRSMGEAQWTAVNGELVGKPSSPDGGWLVLDKSFQDVEFGADFKCADGCKTGVLLRAEKTATGMKGVFVALDGPMPTSFAVTLDASGKELTREPLSGGGGMARFAAGTSPSEAGRAAAVPAGAPGCGIASRRASRPPTNVPSFSL